MAGIDIQVTFDAQTVFERYGRTTDPANPVMVSSDLIFTVTAQDDALSGSAGGELVVHARPEDTIRWREATPSLDFAAILYNFVPALGGSLISTPVPLKVTVAVPLADLANPTTPRTQTIHDYFWNSIVLQPGQTTYHISFMVVSREGEVLGYYWWNPLITIDS